MDRVIFCPDDSMAEEASKLARLWVLPILNGHSPRTKTLDFDDSRVTLLSIPVEKYVECNSPIGVNQLFVFTMVDDFESCKEIKLILMEIDDDDDIERVVGEMVPDIIEEHRIVVKHRFPKPGNYVVISTRNGAEMCKNVVTVQDEPGR